MSESSEPDKETIDHDILDTQIRYLPKMIGSFTPVFTSYVKKIITTFFANTDFINQVLIPISDPGVPAGRGRYRRKSYKPFNKPPTELLSGYFARGDSELAANIATRLHRKQFTRKDFEKEFSVSTNRNSGYAQKMQAHRFYLEVLKPAMTECSGYLAEFLNIALDAVGDYNAICWLFEDDAGNGHSAAQFLSEKLKDYNLTLSAHTIKDLFTYARNFRNQYTHDSDAARFPGFRQKWMDGATSGYKKNYDYEWNYGMQKFQEVFREIAVTDQLKTAFLEYQDDALKISRPVNYYPIPVSEIADNDVRMTYFLSVANKTDGRFIFDRQYFFYDSKQQLIDEISKCQLQDEAENNKTSISELAAEHGIPQEKVTRIIHMPVTEDGYVHVNPKTAESAITAYLKSEAYTHDTITGNHDVPLLKQLASYDGGPLNKELMKELFSTHKIILDDSMFLNKNARNYLRTEFGDLLQTLENEDVEPDIVVTKDVKNELYQGYKKHHADPDQCLNENQGFILLHDLENLQQIKSVGILDPDETKAESIEYILSDDPGQRAVVMMTGNSTWTKQLNQTINPLLTVCRFFMDPMDNFHFTLLKNWYPLKESADISEDYEEEEDYDPVEGSVETSVDNKSARTEPASEQSSVPDVSSETYASVKDREETVINHQSVKTEPVTAKAADPDEKSKDQVPVKDPVIPDNHTQSVKIETMTRQSASLSSRNENYQTKRVLNFKKQKKQVQPKKKPVSLDSSVLISSDPNLMHTEEGTAVHIIGALMEDGTAAEGGEGKIFQTNQKGEVAKIYREKEKAAEVRQKLTDMVAEHIHIPGVCWPQHLLYDNHGEFAGFLMDQVPEGCYTIQKSVWHLDHAEVKDKILPDWDRLSSIKLCARISQLFAKLHRKNILMGDVNPGNIMIDPKHPESVYFVDCDSYQFRDYLCPVGVDEYSSPEFLQRATANGKVHFDQVKRDLHDENYAMAYILFHIMMQCSPFYEVNMDQQSVWKKAHRFSFKDEETPKGLRNSVRFVMWMNMTREVRDCFTNTFRNTSEVTAEQYHRAFNNYAVAMVHFNQPRDLMYDLYIDYTDDHTGTIDLKCQRCGQAFNLPNNDYNRKNVKEGKADRVRFCRHCNEELGAYRNIQQRVTCTSCGKEFTTDMYRIEMARINHQKLICPECRNRFRQYRPNRNRYQH